MAQKDAAQNNAGINGGSPANTRPGRHSSPDPIDLIKAAETKAEEVVASAHGEAASIINDAKKAAQTIIGDSAAASKDKVASAVADALAASDALKDSLHAELDAEMQAMRDEAAKKMSEAVEKIYKLLLS